MPAHSASNILPIMVSLMQFLLYDTVNDIQLIYLVVKYNMLLVILSTLSERQEHGPRVGRLGVKRFFFVRKVGTFKQWNRLLSEITDGHKSKKRSLYTRMEATLIDWHSKLY